ncbi:acyl carrier protein [Actinokineospora sp. NBRC 105648]|uniref:acyl carrier protein n=1 Tax=Actinokineospora sp. NBRC 105648 TaxID=3032206 RepID=UPI0024A1A844|nr:acyl carrier protein [Actinokineospora sp. NBRC 105648]GLZ40810.1 hypothetical protein Acsp05_44340 [Actinokineospora sp. NBRC 105648]
MTTADFVRLVRDELGLEVAEGDLDRDLDELGGWDSVHLLAIAVSLERHAGTQVSLPDLLTARTLGAIHGLVAA